MRERILRNWTGQRIFYAVAGVAICIASVLEREWTRLLLGGYFLSMGIFAFGCAGARGCCKR